MRHKFLTILILLTGIVYLASVLEFDSKEMRQNYQKENHSYLAQNKISNSTNAVFNLLADISGTLHLHTYFLFSTPAKYLGKRPDPDPPRRLYLQNSVLLI